MKQLKRILIECSNTWEGDVKTGIQRVVRNIVKVAPSVEKDFDVESIPVIVKFNRFWRAGKKSKLSLSKARYWDFLKKGYYKLRPFFKCFSSLEKVEYFFILYARRFVSAILGIFFIPLTLRLYPQTKLMPGKGDVLLLLDSSWMYPIWPAVKKAKSDGAIVGLVVYDIIPLTHSEFFPSAIVDRFNGWFKQAIEHVDFFICISETVQNEVQTYLQKNYTDYQVQGRISFFHLGCALDNIDSRFRGNDRGKDGNNRRSWKDRGIRNDKRMYIAVGTIEVRKNHKYLLDAFDLVWQQCPDAGLCIIGKIGWLSEQIVDRIKKHPLFKKNLFMFNNVSDAELDYYYKHSKALIWPSLAEGFGLPIIEALNQGLPVLASDIPINRETGKDFCTYFDINNPDCLAKIIINIEKTGNLPQVRNNKEYKLTTWEDSCRELFNRIQDLTADKL